MEGRRVAFAASSGNVELLPEYSITLIRMDNRRMKNSFGVMTKNNKIYMDLKEIIREHALRYLPAKALSRSLSVCRDWKLQIKSPFFVHNQSVSFFSISGFFLQSPGSPPSFITHDHMAYGVPDPELKFLPEPVDLKASSNGLLCCQGRTGDKAYYVCNPVNQQWKKLPKPTANHGSDPVIALEFNPSLLNFLADYKVVCIFPSSDIEEAYEFEIYSSLQDSWKVSKEMFFITNKLTFTRGISVNGVVYWTTNSGVILIFDLKIEKAVQFNSYCGYSGQSNTTLGMIDGKLCTSSLNGLAVTVNVLRTIHANTMPLKSRTNIWEMKHHVQLNSAELGGNFQLQVLLMWDHVILLRARAVGKVFVHDMRTQTTTLCSESHRDNGYVFPYVNSLVSLM